MTQGRWTTLAVLLLAALWLAGCGGGGDGGVKQDLEGQLEALMAERDVAKAAQQTAEAARAAAEEARTTADAARKAADEARATAETERDAAKAAQMEAEADKAEAEAAQAEAVAAQAEAEAAQTAAEATRDAAVKARTAAETARDEARDAKTQAEIDLIAAESAQALAERRRDAANTAKTAAETQRDDALAARQSAETQRDEALAAKTTAENALAEANTSKTMTEGELATVRQELAIANGNLQMAQDDLKDASDDLKDTQDDLMEAQDDLQTANDELVTVKKERDDAVRDLARAEGTLEGLRSQLTQAQQDTADAEQRGREAEAEADRRIEEAEQQTNIALRAPKWIIALDSMVVETGIRVEHEPRKARKVEPTGDYTCGSASPSISGFSGISCSRQRGAVGDETLRLYTNIQSPSGKAFWKKYGAMVDIRTPAVLSLAKSSSTTRTTGASGEEETTLSGTFDGVGGTFSCDGVGTACTVTKSTDAQTRNQFTAVAGVWTFKPSTSGLRARVPATQDSEYLYFGIWEFQPNDATDLTDLHEFKWIRGGDTNTDDPDDAVVAMDAIDNLGSLEGTAKFNGSAIGKYVLRNQVGQDDKIGTFTAKASFTADFDASPNNKLDGRITDFREGGSSLAGWTVYLGGSENEAADINALVASGEAHASIGGVTAEGAWNATLYGSDNPGFVDFGGDGEPRCPVTTVPGGRSGWRGWLV